MEEAGAYGNMRRVPALLPPIPLYRRILRTHRKKLPVEERTLGDMYVKAEFKAHKDIDNPVQIVSKFRVDMCEELPVTCIDRIPHRVANVCSDVGR